MKKFLLGLVGLGIPFLVPCTVNAAIFSEIIAFGDSLSDTGNVNSIVETATGGQASFPPAPYFNGRFSNGPVWLEYLSESLNIPLTDEAFGGATSGTANTLDTTFSMNGLDTLVPSLFGLEQQINTFVSANPTADPNALYVIWIGANNYLPTDSAGFTPDAEPTTPLADIQNSINELQSVGATQIMVVNLPDLGEVPRTLGNNLDGSCPPNNQDQFDADCLNELVQAHNSGLTNLVAPAGTTLIPLDVNTLLANIIDNPTQFSLSNVTEGCISISCTNPDEFLFWDNLHPTTQGHQLMANLALRTLGVPEPSTVLGLIVFGAISIFVPRKIRK